MSNYQKNNSQLICITGFMGSGKSTATEYFKNNNIKVFKMDEYIHSVYLPNEIGFNLIKQEFGDEYINPSGVDRQKLKELIVNDKSAKQKLDSTMLNVMLEKIKELYLSNTKMVVELGIYIYNQVHFYNYFKKVIAITSKRDGILDNFKKFHDGYKFSTKHVENLKMLVNTSIVFVDYVVENNTSLDDLFKQLEKFLWLFD